MSAWSTPRCGRPLEVSSIFTATTVPVGTGASPVNGFTGGGVGDGVGVGVGGGAGAAIDSTGGDGVGGLTTWVQATRPTDPASAPSATAPIRFRRIVMIGLTPG